MSLFINNCLHCKKEYKRYICKTSKKSNFCSKKCQGEYQKTSLLGENNPNYVDGNCLDRGIKLEKRFEILDPIIIKNINQAKSYVELSELCRDEGVDFGGRNSIKNRIKELNLDINHFMACRDRKIPNEKLFIIGEIKRRGIIKTRILELKLIEYKCSECSMIDIWQNEKITLELDHINGNPLDNRLENLRFLCPNCHSQTETYHIGSKKK